MAINKRERNLLVVIITLAFLGINYLLIAPRFGDWQKIDHDMALRQHDLSVVTNMIARIPQLQSDYDKLGHNLKQSEHFEAFSDVLKKIDDIGAASGVLMQSKRSLKLEEHDVYREWPVRCQFESTTESLVKFLVGLQSGSGFLTVEQLTITTKPDNSGILNCDIQIRALAAKGDRAAL